MSAEYGSGSIRATLAAIPRRPVVLGAKAVVFGVVAYSASARLLLARESWKLGDDLPKGPLMKIYGFVVGLLSTLMGIGGGLFANLLMTFHGRPRGRCRSSWWHTLRGLRWPSRHN